MKSMFSGVITHWAATPERYSTDVLCGAARWDVYTTNFNQLTCLKCAGVLLTEVQNRKRELECTPPMERAKKPKEQETPKQSPSLQTHQSRKASRPGVWQSSKHQKVKLKDRDSDQGSST